MPQTPEAQAFITRIEQLPRGPGSNDALVEALQPSLNDEAELRKLFTTDKGNARLQNPYVGLVNVFDAPSDIRTTRARIVADEDDLSARHVLPLSDKQRRKEGEPAIVSSLDEFRKNWAIFSEGSLSQLTHWSNVVVAGGSVQACLMPVPDSAKTSKRAMRKYFNSNAFPTSDVDVFLYGLTPEQAEAKMQVIYEAVRDSVPWDVTCIRTKHTVSIHSQYPYRSVQIVLRLYASPAEILAGFDVDAPCCLFDGERVWANPRAIVAMMRQCNTVDMTRRSPSYEVRLAKYSARGFEVEVSNLCRGDIDPTIFERSIVRVQGLARLLVLERLADPNAKTRYIADRRYLRTRPPAEEQWRSRRKQLKGDLKANIDLGGLQMNDYDVQSLHIPYGPGWDARRIDKLVYQTDLGMNSPYNPKNKDRRLHRHPAFFGTLEECLEDCCECCLEPKNDEEKKLQEMEDDSYVRGRVQFIEENPGRQSLSGSFNPIDVGEWAEQAYMGPTEKLFNAIANGDRSTVARILAEEGTDVDRRDHVGRTPLQVAILSKDADIACDLIDAGARMTSRLVDGRTALHLAAQVDQPVVVRKLLERSEMNAEKAKEEEAAKQAQKDEATVISEDDAELASVSEGDEDEEHDCSEDDWSSVEGESKDGKGDMAQDPDAGQFLEDEKDMPDVFDVNLPDWDYAFTPLHYAVVFGSLSAMDELLAAGADAKVVTKASRYRAQALHPLTVTAITRDVEAACEAAKKLIASGAISSEADENLFTIFHKIVCAGRPTLMETLLNYDPNAKAVIDSPHMVNHNWQAMFPIVSAIAKGDHLSTAILLAYGANHALSEESFHRARELKKHAWQLTNDDWRRDVYVPVEVSLSCLNEVVELLVDIGAEYNMDIKTAGNDGNDPNAHMTILDYVRAVIPALQAEADAYLTRADKKAERVRFRELADLPGWQGARGAELLKWSETLQTYEHNAKEYVQMRERCLAAIAYYHKAEEILVAHGAKTAKELFGPDAQVNTNFHRNYTLFGVPEYSAIVSYQKMSGGRSFHNIPNNLTSLYDELFEACRVGDVAKVQALCLPKDGRGKSDTKLLQITCTFLNNQGLSPLSMALNNRQWETARLILAIAVAQYKPKTEKQSNFVAKSVVLEADDSGDDSECESDEELEMQREINFVDIAHRPSEVHTDIPPEQLLELADWVYSAEGDNWRSGPPLFKAVVDNDFEAFVQIADLYKTLPKPREIPADAIIWVCDFDRPTMLDELIRRTGAGVELPESHDESEGDDAPRSRSKHPSAKSYLGLNVHGKKRKDLAEKADPNAPGTTKSFEVPLLWTAARANATGVMQYLASDRPLAAYDYYMSTNSGEKAKYLRRVRGQMRERLGWSNNELNESAVTAAVIGGHLGALKELIALQPAKMQSALMLRIHFVGFNHILVGANWGCSPEMFDYLLSNGISPTETDMRGWNAYHLLCDSSTSERHLKLLKHVLQKLPQDVTARMLLHQSKGALNTPLHIAVKRKSLPAVRLLLEFTAPMFALRDNSGSTPLHVAVKKGLPEIARLVGDAGPAEVLHLENGVGNTPLEIVTQMWLQRETETDVAFKAPRVEELTRAIHEYQWSHDKIRQASVVDVAHLKDTIERLVASGRLRRGTKLATALDTFVEKLGVKAKLRAEEEEERKQADTLSGAGPHAKPSSDERDVLKTYEYVVGAVSARAARRGLVHLDDVQRSVRASLERSARDDEHQQKRDNDGLEPEVVEDEDTKIKKRSLLAQFQHSELDSSLFEADPW